MIFLGYDCLGKPAIYLYVYMTRNISYIKIIIMYIYTNKNTCIQFINIIMRYSKASMYRLCIIQTTSNKGFPVFIACFQVISRTQVGILLLYRISNRFCIGSSRHPIRVSSASVRSKKKMPRFGGYRQYRSSLQTKVTTHPQNAGDTFPCFKIANYESGIQDSGKPEKERLNLGYVSKVV